MLRATFDNIGNQYKRDDAVGDMFGGALERSMRMLFGDPDGDAVRKAIPDFQARYNHHRKRYIDRYGDGTGSLASAVADARRRGWYGAKTDAEIQKILEDQWRSSASDDMRNYDLAEQRHLRESNYGFQRPRWMSY